MTITMIETSSRFDERYGTVAERVARGVERLDERVPRWRERVDYTTLQIAGANTCVLGQLFGTYYANEALDIVDYNSPTALRLGFDVPTIRLANGRPDHEATRTEAIALDAEWRRVLTCDHEGSTVR